MGNQDGSMFMLVGVPPAKEWTRIRGLFRFNGPEMALDISAKNNASQYEASFRFQVDPLELGAAMILCLNGHVDADFLWPGQAHDGTPWVMRSYWFRRPSASVAREVEVVERALKAGSEEEKSAGLEALSRLKRALGREPMYILSVERMTGEEIFRFPFLLTPGARLGVYQVCRHRVLESVSTRLIGGLMVVVDEKGVSVAAGSSSLLRLSEEQRAGLRFGLQLALKSRRFGFRMEQVGYFVPRGEQSVWEVGARIDVLGRIAPVPTPREAAKLLVVL